MNSKYFIYGLFLFLSSACSTISKQINTEHSGVFFAPYSVIWQATRLALKDYPIKNVIDDSGQLETELIKGYSVWKPPPYLISNTRNRQYQIKVFLEKGVSNNTNKKAVKIRVIKEEYINKDFVEQSIPIDSNGIEEEVILYRINRELFLQNEKKKLHLKKVNKFN